jgi:midasin
MVKDVNHFLMSFCHPKNLLSIIKLIESSIVTKNKNKSQLVELMSKLELWISNADKFINHTLRNYQIYYRDFIAPIEYSVTLLKNGFLGLKSLLQMRNDSIVMRDNEIWDCNENGELLNVMKELVEYPMEFSSINSNKHLLFTIETFNDDSEGIFFKLVKSQIKQIQNNSTTAKNLNPDLFKKFDEILNICNQVWQKQEETRRKKQIEEDSLYITKTKCVEDDEETVKQREIEEIFPETTNDFFEYSRKDTLEQVKVVEKKKKFVDIITDDDYKLIGDFFINLMNEKCENKDYLAVFDEKLKVFHCLFEKFSTCFENSLDDVAYRGLSLLVGVCQENYDELQLKGKFY